LPVQGAEQKKLLQTILDFRKNSLSMAYQVRDKKILKVIVDMQTSNFTWEQEKQYRSMYVRSVGGSVIWPSYERWSQWWQVRRAPDNYHDWSNRMEAPRFTGVTPR